MPHANEYAVNCGSNEAWLDSRCQDHEAGSTRIYFNAFAQGPEPLDLSGTQEMVSLLESAAEWGLQPPDNVRYLSRSVIANGMRFHFLEWGAPELPPLLILHGNGQSAHTWDLVSLTLSQRYHVFAVDQRGHGDSEWPRDADMTLTSMRADLRAVLAALGLERPALIAHSMGGMVSLSLLAEEPFASRFVCVDIGPEIGNVGGNRIADFMRVSQEFESEDEYIEQVLGFEPRRTREQVLRTLPYNLLKRADDKLVRKAFRRLPSAPMGVGRPTLDDVSKIACPVLVVRGAESDILMPDAAERFVAALPRGELVTVPNCGHNVHSQNTTGFLDVIAPFLSTPAR